MLLLPLGCKSVLCRRPVYLIDHDWHRTPLLTYLEAELAVERLNQRYNSNRTLGCRHKLSGLRPWPGSSGTD